QQERIASLARNHFLDLVAGQVVEQTGPVAAPGGDDGALRQIEHRGTFSQRFIAGGHAGSEYPAQVRRDGDDDQARDGGQSHHTRAPLVVGLYQQQGYGEDVHHQQEFDAQQNVIKRAVSGIAENIVESGQGKATNGKVNHGAETGSRGLVQRPSRLGREL